MSALLFSVIVASGVFGQTTFSNATPIAIADGTAGVGPGVGSVYPSNIPVSGFSGPLTKVTVRINGLSHDFPDDVELLLVGPTGVKLVLQSDALGGDATDNLTYTFDQAAATQLADAAAPAEGGSVRPGNHAGNAFEVFPAPAPAAPYLNPGPEAGGTPGDLNNFNGTDPNGTWSLYVVDDEAVDAGSINGGWTLTITAPTGAAPPDAPVDMNGDGSTDWVVVRNTGGGQFGQMRWFIRITPGSPLLERDWGLASDYFVPGDFDGDRTDDIAVWRAATQSTFYIMLSLTNTIRIEDFGLNGDDPTVIADYNNDGKDDLAVFRSDASGGTQSYWFYRTSPLGPTTVIPWGLAGDSPAPGDYDADGRSDFVIQRGNQFFQLTAAGIIDIATFGQAGDYVVPGDYDGDGKTDLAVARPQGGFLKWDYRSSLNGATVNDEWGFPDDYPTPGDYNGDGRSDYSVWRESNGTFYFKTPQTSFITIAPWGLAGDYPVANYRQY